MILPVRQDMHGDEVDRRRDVAMAQPELPHVGIGHRASAPCALTSRMVRASSGADISPRSSTSLPTMTASITSGNRLASSIVAVDLPAVELRQAREPQPVQHLHAVALGDLRNLVEPVIDRIGADAIGQRLELGEVLVDLPGLDMGAGPERVLVAPERRIGHAVELARPRPSGACGISTAAPSQLQTATIAAAASANRAAAMRIVRVPRATPPALRLSCRRDGAKRADVATPSDDRRPATLPAAAQQLFAVPYWRQRRPAALIDAAAAPGRLPRRMRRSAAAVAAMLTESGPQVGEQRPDRPNNPEQPWSLPVCVSSPPSLARRCFLLSRRPRHWPRAPTPRPATRPARPSRRRRTASSKLDEFAEAGKAPGRPGRQSRMRLARPAGGQPAVARRSRHRLPPSRPLRPVRMSGRPHPGDVPLPGPAGQHRSQGAGHACRRGCTPAGSIRTSSARHAGRSDHHRPPRPSGTTNR